MLTTKNRLGCSPVILMVAALGVLTGCGEPGVRALLKGDRLITEGKYDQALAPLQQAAERLPNDARAWNHLGLALQYSGDPAKASEAYKKALELDRNLAAARYNLGCALLEQNQFAAAADEFTTYSALDRQNINGWLKLGTAQLRQAGQLSGSERVKWLEAAKRNAETSLTIDRSAEAYNLLGVIDIQRNRPRDALREFGSALQKQPNYPAALLNLAVTYQVYLNDTRDAVPKYRAFLGTQPPEPESTAVQEILQKLDETNPAQVGHSSAPNKPAEPPTPSMATSTRDSQSAVQTLRMPRYKYSSPPKPAPGNRTRAIPLYEKGSRFQQSGNSRGAIDLLRQAVVADPSYFEAYFRLALAAYAVGDWKTSLEASEHALAIKPDSTGARYNFALALEKAGYPQDASIELEKILLQNPSDARAHLSLANLYAQKLQQKNLAREHYRKVLELQPQHPEAAAIRQWLQENR